MVICSMNNDDFYINLGRLEEYTKQIANSTEAIKDNLKKLNDHNILHAERCKKEHETALSKIQELTTRHWYFIIALFIIILVIMGYQEIVTNILVP